MKKPKNGYNFFVVEEKNADIPSQTFLTFNPLPAKILT